MIKGVKELIRTLRGIRTRVPVLVEQVLLSQAVELQARAIAVAPEKTRALVISSKVTRASRGGRPAISVSFDQPYAVKQHEDFHKAGPLTALKTPTQDGVPGRKYLQRPYENMLEQIQRKVGEAVIQAARDEGAK